MSRAIVEVSDLSKIYSSRRKEVRAVDHISFTVQRGEVVGLLGPNGAGKTTTIKCLCTLIRPTSGRIMIDGGDVLARPTKALQKIAAVLEGNRNVYWRLSPRENLEFFAGLQGDAPRGTRIPRGKRAVLLWRRPADLQVLRAPGPEPRALGALLKGENTDFNRTVRNVKIKASTVPLAALRVAVCVLCLVVAPHHSLVTAQEVQRLERDRRAMVDLIVAHGVEHDATLEAMRRVPRHEFVPSQHLRRAYGDHPLPIGYGQTISQPYIVAYMTEVLQPIPGMKVLEVGTGSGYQAAVLAAIGCEVYTVELIGALAEAARQRLERLEYDNVTVQHADGHYGWSEHAPFDAVIVTAAAGYIPPALIEQLKMGGRMVIPVGSVYGVQNLILVEKHGPDDIRTRTLLPVRFVPMLQGVR